MAIYCLYRVINLIIRMHKINSRRFRLFNRICKKSKISKIKLCKSIWRVCKSIKISQVSAPQTCPLSMRRWILSIMILTVSPRLLSKPSAAASEVEPVLIITKNSKGNRGPKWVPALQISKVWTILNYLISIIKGRWAVNKCRPCSNNRLFQEFEEQRSANVRTFI